MNGISVYNMRYGEKTVCNFTNYRRLYYFGKTEKDFALLRA